MLFTKHLKEIDESYFEHFSHALYFCFSCFYAGLALFIHSFLPFLFITTGGSTITKLFGIMSIRAEIVMLNNSKRKKVAIIGFGASGIMTFHNLVRFHKNNAKSLLEIYIFDKSPINKGIAYSTKNVNHLLNVRAKGMSVVEEDNLHFVSWLKVNGYKYSQEDFVPRVIYGLYL